ncbi:hypothetical protein JD969_17440 [Planctomycetota bacterium]|nr:hypothetical protein JD969_17440 [Planctomycetota bacterium]
MDIKNLTSEQRHEYYLAKRTELFTKRALGEFFEFISQFQGIHVSGFTTKDKVAYSSFDCMNVLEERLNTKRWDTRFDTKIQNSRPTTEIIDWFHSLCKQVGIQNTILIDPQITVSFGPAVRRWLEISYDSLDDLARLWIAYRYCMTILDTKNRQFFETFHCEYDIEAYISQDSDVSTLEQKYLTRTEDQSNQLQAIENESQSLIARTPHLFPAQHIR